MDKRFIVFISSVFLFGYIFLPILFRNIPFPGIGTLIYVSFIFIFFFRNPKILLNSQMLVLGLFILVYFFSELYGSNRSNYSWLEGPVLNIFLGISFFMLIKDEDKTAENLRRFFFFTFIVIVISSITTYIGLIRFPEASRDLAGSASINEVEVYKKIGIMGYGFITSLTYMIPIAFILFRNAKIKRTKILYAISIIVFTMTVIKAQYTAQFLFFVFAFFLSVGGITFYRRIRLLLFIIVILLLVTPNAFYVQTIDTVATFLPGETLKERLNDLSNTIEQGDISDSDTHMSARFDRIPFLLSEFYKNPILGGGESTGHVFWLDHLSRYGIIGSLPWVFLLIGFYSKIKSLLKKSFYYFQISFYSFILIGFMKGSGSKEQLIILFFVLPLGLYLYENNFLEPENA